VTFAVSLLRAGGATHPVELTKYQGRNRTRRAVAAMPREQNYWTLARHSYEIIYRLLDSVFKDEEAG